MYYNMAKAPSACSHSFGGPVCFHSFGGSACFLSFSGSACFLSFSGSVCFHSFGGPVCFHSFGGSAGGTESGLSPSSHPASSAARRTCLLRLSIAPDSSACLSPAHPSACFHPPIHPSAFTCLTHPSVFTRPPIYQLSPACTHPPAPIRVLSGPLKLFRHASSTQTRKWVAHNSLIINENVNLKCRNLHFKFSIFLNHNELPATRFCAGASREYCSGNAGARFCARTHRQHHLGNIRARFCARAVCVKRNCIERLAQVCFFLRHLRRKTVFCAQKRRRYLTFLHTCAMQHLLLLRATGRARSASIHFFSHWPGRHSMGVVSFHSWPGNARRASRAAGLEPGETRRSVAAAPRCRAAAVPSISRFSSETLAAAVPNTSGHLKRVPCNGCPGQAVAMNPENF